MEKLIVKYLNDTISAEEMGQLDQWLKTPENQKVFEEYVRNTYDVHLAFEDGDTESAYRKLKQSFSESRIIKLNPVWYKYAVAIALVLILGLGYLYQQGYFVSSKIIVPQLEDITLELDNGQKQVITPGMNSTITNARGQILGHQEYDRITYTSPAQTEELVYNTLRVPYGRKFEVVLSDGSAVHLQAGTSLRFPIGFSSSGKRIVYLEGEAYFKIAENKELPFVVVSDELNVEVTGTAFNMSAYPEDLFYDVVLEQGGVGMYTTDQSLEEATMLTPGYIGSFSREDLTISTKPVNTSIYTSWLDGKLTFRNMAFDNILQKLERHYNIEMINQNDRLGKEIFNASFDKDETVENVLQYFNESYKIQFTINDNAVIIQ